MLLANSVVFAGPDTRSSVTAKKRASARLVSLLPQSDGIAVIDSKRFLDDALPKVLSANQPMLAEVMSKVKDMEAKTGIDLRKFNQLTVGVATKQVTPTEVDFEAVAIASGDLDVATVVNAARAAAKGPVREEKIGARTVYIFSGKELATKVPAAPANSKIASAFDSLIAGMGKKEVAVTAYDSGTLVIGVPERVRQTLLDSKTKNDADVRSLLPATGTAVLAFAFRTNGLLDKLLSLDADVLGANLSSIQYLTGSMDVTAGSTSLQAMARTTKPEQAADLKTTLEGLQMVGKAFLGASKRLDQQVYGRMLQNAKFAARGTDVTLDLAVPQGDIDILVGGLK